MALTLITMFLFSKMDNINRLKVRKDFHSFRTLCANWRKRISTLFFTHCTIDCCITIQVVAVNRYVYQHPRTARDKYILVFSEYESRSVFLPGTGETPTVVLSSVRSDGVRKGAKRTALEL